MTKFNYSAQPWWHFAYEAAMQALENSGMSIKEIDAIVLTSMSSSVGGEHQTHKNALLSDLFKVNIPIIETSSVCGGGGVATWTANKLNLNNVLVIGAERLVDDKSEATVNKILSAAERVIEQTEGMVFPAQNALVAQQYMKKANVRRKDLDLVAYKNHQNATLNPKAYYYKRPVDMKKIKSAPVVASPFTLFDCSLSVNGGAAMVLSQEATDIELVGSGFATDYLLTFLRENISSFRATRLAGEQAFSQAGIERSNIDVAEIHDAFTSVELFSYEDLGFASEGEAKELIRSGKVNLNGELPVNPSGGLKAKGHPISATGVAQFYEIVNQLRQNCGKRQVDSPKYGLAHNIGGAGGSCTVHILKKNKES